MRRLIAVTCVGLLALSAPLPALAQGGQTGQGYGAGGQGNQSFGVADQGNQGYGAGDQGNQGQGNQGNGGTGDQATGGTSGLDAFAQVPPTGNISPFLIIGGIAGGAGLIAYAVSQNQNDNPTSP